ncbi:MAG: hypothetical protein BGO01_15355 [Armatimonadetes bacterium 55-13]|nr:DsbA family protein [Armatimonadota bacterium]OJU65242.1 MAG: hypothetical protein BGO01_15355 [Armatimonadetes bacterium 55-13]
MSKTIPVAHDFICGWCYVGLFQAERLKQEFGIEIDWLAFELYPNEMEWLDTPARPEPANRPRTLTRFELLLACEEMELPKVERPRKMRSHLAHLAAEYAKANGKGWEFVKELYLALWQRGEYINEIEFLTRTGEQFGLDPTAMRKSIESEEFDDKITKFDAPAFTVGVYNVPTFYIGNERYAEQPYRTLQRAIAETQVPT